MSYLPAAPVIVNAANSTTTPLISLAVTGASYSGSSLVLTGAWAGGAANAYVGFVFWVSGFTGAATGNNSTGSTGFTCTASSAGSVTLTVVGGYNGLTGTPIAAQMFIGTSVDCTAFVINSVSVASISDKVSSGTAGSSPSAFSAEPGIQLQFSPDNTNWDVMSSTVYNTYDVGAGRALAAPVNERYFRVVYINGPTTQTYFRLQTVVSSSTAAVSINANGQPIGAYQDADGDWCLATSSIQNVTADKWNTSSSPINSGTTYSGNMVTTLGVAAIRVMFKSDQPCTVYIDQSGDGTNYDVIDSYSYIPSKSFGVTVQVVGTSYRVRVTNNGAITTVTFRLETFLCPVVESVPRSLDSQGYLQTGIKAIQDQNGFPVQSNSSHTLHVNQPYRLVGTAFGSAIDTNFWTAATSGAASASGVANSVATISSGTAASGYGKLTSVRSAQYIANHPLKFRTIIQLPTLSIANNTMSWGAVTLSTVTPQNGAWFSVLGGALNINYANATAVTTVASGSFNGTVTQVILDTKFHIYEIIYAIAGVYFFVDDVLIHSVALSGQSGILYQIPTYPINVWSANTVSGSASGTIVSAGASILRLGRDKSAPYSYFTSTIQAGQLLKLGSGLLHRIVVGVVVNNAVITVYDGTSTGGTVLWASGALATGGGANVTPYSLDFGEIPFFTGLFITVTGAAANVAFVYE